MFATIDSSSSSQWSVKRIAELKQNQTHHSTDSGAVILLLVLLQLLLLLEVLHKVVGGHTAATTVAVVRLQICSSLAFVTSWMDASKHYCLLCETKKNDYCSRLWRQASERASEWASKGKCCEMHCWSGHQLNGCMTGREEKKWATEVATKSSGQRQYWTGKAG